MHDLWNFKNFPCKQKWLGEIESIDFFTEIL